MPEIDLLTIGDSSIDLFMIIEQNAEIEKTSNESPKICFVHGSKIPVEHFETSIAGNAINVAVGAGKLGLKTAIYSELGDDSNSDRILAELNSQKINTDYCIRNKDTPTNLHAVVVFQKERTIFSYHDKRKYEIKAWPVPKWIYYTSLGEGFKEFQPKLFEYAKNNKCAVAFNPGTIQLKADDKYLVEALFNTHVLFVNLEEAQRITKTNFSINEISGLHTKLQEMGPKITVITCGDKGASVFDGTQEHFENVYQSDKPIKDKTGAGDAFSSAFLSALFYNKTLKEALKWGIKNSGGCVREIGSIKGLLNKEQIEND